MQTPIPLTPHQHNPTAQLQALSVALCCPHGPSFPSASPATRREEAESGATALLIAAGVGRQAGYRVGDVPRPCLCSVKAEGSSWPCLAPRTSADICR